MIGVQSLWTGTTRYRLTRGTALIHTLSLCLAGRVFPYMELVTDRRGIQIAQRLGWHYGTFVRALDDFAPPRARHIWALGKLEAIRLQARAFCHLDNDVLLFKPLPRRVVTARIFAQNADPLVYYASPCMDRAIKESSAMRKIFKPYNTGVIGGTDPALLSEYGRRSIAAAGRLSADIDGTTASMACEQCWLGQYAYEKRVDIEPLLDLERLDADAHELGYCHLVGSSKHEAHWQSKAELRLARDFPEAYERFISGWTTLAKLERIAA